MGLTIYLCIQRSMVCPQSGGQLPCRPEWMGAPRTAYCQSALTAGDSRTGSELASELAQAEHYLGWTGARSSELARAEAHLGWTGAGGISPRPGPVGPTFRLRSGRTDREVTRERDSSRTQWQRPVVRVFGIITGAGRTSQAAVWEVQKTWCRWLQLFLYY